MTCHTGRISRLPVAALADPPGRNQAFSANVELVRKIGNGRFNDFRLMAGPSVIIIEPDLQEIGNDFSNEAVVR